MLRVPANQVMMYLRVRSFIIIIIILTTVKHSPSAYNINLRDARIFHDPAHARTSGARGNYFGFSVALYAGANESLLLVGAPRANSSELPSVMEPGAVFKCWTNGTCGKWPIDETGSRPQFYNAKTSQIKDHAWIGATIAVENSTKARVVVCLPLSLIIVRSQR